jgi:hypothetical protein
VSWVALAKRWARPPVQHQVGLPARPRALRTESCGAGRTRRSESRPDFRSRHRQFGVDRAGCVVRPGGESRGYVCWDCLNNYT